MILHMVGCEFIDSAAARRFQGGRRRGAQAVFKRHFRTYSVDNGKCNGIRFDETG
jgi:hypothetical protein